MSTFKKEIVFTGVGTALITPFLPNGEVDYPTFGKLIDWQIEKGVDSLVICGTTGEGSTLSDEEHKACIKYAAERIAGRVPMVAGTGSNDTAYSVELSKYACDVGADGLLLVSPYYNKATPKGLIRCFMEVADVVNKPIILYNVPSRTGVNIPMSVYRECAKHERIVAVKEASGNMSLIAEIAAELSDSLAIYSGNDDQIVPVMSLGGKGVISVLSNVMPAETAEICRLWREGKTTESAALQLKLLDLINALFIEVNPIPVKAACAAMGLCDPAIRLPLCEMEDKNFAVLEAALKKHSLL